MPTFFMSNGSTSDLVSASADTNTAATGKRTAFQELHDQFGVSASTIDRVSTIRQQHWRKSHVMSEKRKAGEKRSVRTMNEQIRIFQSSV